MISISKLIGGSENFGDTLRYNSTSRHQKAGAAAGYGPVVVWNMTRACNLHCVHCYAAADNRRGNGELSTSEARNFINDLAEFKVPVLLLSGGEPLTRPDFFDLAGHAVKLGIRVTLSTNGTLITPEVARCLKNTGISYVGISLDGVGKNNDLFRGRKGAFEEALQGIRNCLAVGQRVGLRFTITRYNFNELNAIFDLIEEENIPRACFYHLAYSGRGSTLMDQDLTHEQSREAVDLIVQRTFDFHRKGSNKEVLTVNNHADGAYVHLKLQHMDSSLARTAYRLLRYNGGNRAGIALGAVDWEGNVHPDQFTFNHTFGNIRQRKFGEIWQDTSHPVLAGLRNRQPLLKGRCPTCCWLDICNGNSRGRAEAVYQDYWASDPACYLSDTEILKIGGCSVGFSHHASQAPSNNPPFTSTG